MIELEVWAPRARNTVTVLLDDGARTVSMSPTGGGWFHTSVDAPVEGVSYAFMLDDRGPFPDPRSAWQPEGVHGFSHTVDHTLYAWGDGRWQGRDVRDGVVYELHVGTFSPTGDFAGVVEHLDHLVALGVDAIELMPICEFSGTRNWGYDGTALFAPHHAYGGPIGLKRLVDAAHQRGLAVLLDVVYNHLGPEGNYLSNFGPYFTDCYKTPWGEAVNFDRAGSDQVRGFVIENATMWLRDYHLDGLRIDAVHAIVDTSATHILEELASAVDELELSNGRPLTLIAESDLNDPKLCRSVEVGGYGLDAQWNDDFHHALHAVLTGEHDGYYADFGSVTELATAIERGWLYSGNFSRFRDRRHGRAPESLDGRNLVGYSQNHDQIGNRAHGERLATLVGPDRARVAAALVLTAPFVPLLFQGEEWGAATPFQYFTDHQDRELGRSVAQGRRSEFASFGWDPETLPDPQDISTFERSRIDWGELGRPPHDRLLEWYRALLELRRREPALAAGPLTCGTEVAPDESWLRVDRDHISVAINLAARIQRVPCRSGRVLLAAGLEADVEGGVLLGPDGVAIIEEVKSG